MRHAYRRQLLARLVLGVQKRLRPGLLLGQLGLILRIVLDHGDLHRPGLDRLDLERRLRRLDLNGVHARPPARVDSSRAAATFGAALGAGVGTRAGAAVTGETVPDVVREEARLGLHARQWNAQPTAPLSPPSSPFAREGRGAR